MRLPDTFTVVQSNGWSVRFRVRTVEGQRTFTDADATGPDGETMDGDIEDSEIGSDSFVVTVEWDGGGKGRYVGRRELDGKLNGTTSDVNNPTSQATWFCDQFIPE